MILFGKIPKLIDSTPLYGFSYDNGKGHGVGFYGTSYNSGEEGVGEEE